MHRDKIFGLGFHKTGTSSLAAALSLLGYRTIHGDARSIGGSEGRELIRLIEQGDYDLPPLSRYDAFLDNPYFTIWRVLLERYPDARFILTERDEESWIRSCVHYYAGRRVRPMREWMFGEHADPSTSGAARAAWLSRYRGHNEDIKRSLNGDSRFLLMNIIAGDGWQKLCSFLEAPVPNRPFPHSNRSRTGLKSNFLRRKWVALSGFLKSISPLRDHDY